MEKSIETKNIMNFSACVASKEQAVVMMMVALVLLSRSLIYDSVGTKKTKTVYIHRMQQEWIHWVWGAHNRSCIKPTAGSGKSLTCVRAFLLYKLLVVVSGEGSRSRYAIRTSNFAWAYLKNILAPRLCLFYEYIVIMNIWR